MRYLWMVIICFLILLAGCSHVSQQEVKPMEESKEYKTATFAGGCFWCIEAAFEDVPGVIDAVSGYSGGDKENPSYEEVSRGNTGHLESVQITYDPNKVTYMELLDLFWRQIDPTDDGGQFADRGEEYRTAVFYHDEEQKAAAEASKKMLEMSGKFDKPVVTKILPAKTFWKAEEYHQDYSKKRTADYQRYAEGSGRKGFIEENWKDAEFTKPSEEELKEMLTPVQYEVTQQCSTETPFENEYWDEKREGIYVDIVSGEVLFSSKDKFDSGTGWPSFTKPLVDENIIEKHEKGLLDTRTEVRSRLADSHLGHVFEDGPGPNGLRYCINSASLRFIPKEDLETEGYGEYLSLFED